MRLCGRELLWSLTRYFINLILYSDRGSPHDGRSLPQQPSSWPPWGCCSPGVAMAGRGLTSLNRRPLASRNRGQECWQKVPESPWNPSEPAWLSFWTHPPHVRVRRAERPPSCWGGTRRRGFRCRRQAAKMSCLTCTMILWSRLM